MNRWILLAAALACLPVTVDAGVISRDWKASGDGLLTHDDVNQREWLDLAQSQLSIFPGSTLEQRYQNALLELVPGGMFEGFIAAKEVDLAMFAQSAGINVLSNEDFATNQAPTANLIDFVGISENFRDGEVLLSFGQLDELGSLFDLQRRKFGILVVDLESGPNGQAGVSFNLHGADGIATSDNTGVWLYRPVPEPSGLMLIACCMWSFVIIKNKP